MGVPVKRVQANASRGSMPEFFPGALLAAFALLALALVASAIALAPGAAQAEQAIPPGSGGYAGMSSEKARAIRPQAQWSNKKYFWVYRQVEGEDEREVACVLSKDEFEGMKSDSETPVSALYYSDRVWKVSTATEYVTLEDVIEAAGLTQEWKSGASISYGGDPTQGKQAASYTYDQVQEMRWFFPAAAGSYSNECDPVPAPFVFSIWEYADPTDQSYPAAMVERSNCLMVNQLYEPRVLFGITEQDYYDRSGNVDGLRLWQATHDVTITVPPGGEEGEAPGAEDGSSDTPEPEADSDEGVGAGAGADSSAGGEGERASSGADAGGGARADALEQVSAEQAVLVPVRPASDELARAEPVRRAQSMTFKAKTAKLKVGKLRKARRVVKPGKAFSLRGAHGAVSFAVSRYDKKAKKKIRVCKDGRVIVAKGLGKGTYTLKVSARAAGDAEYLPATASAKLKVKVA